MGKHDDYGKELLKQLLEGRWDQYSYLRSIDEGGVRADLDGVIWSRDSKNVGCAVEIEAKIYKQIRGAIVDLALHTAPKKLLIIMRAQPQLGTREQIDRHCSYIWDEIAGMHRGEFAVACLEGTGNAPEYQKDKGILVVALRKLDIL